MILPLLFGLATSLAAPAEDAGAPDEETVVSEPIAGSPREVTVVPEPPAPADGDTFPGRFDGGPVPHWSRDLPGERVNAPSHAERARPVLSGTRIYVGAAGGEALYALSRESGSLEQTYEADGPVNAEPLVLRDRLFFTDTAGTTWAYAIDGELLWRRTGSAPQPTRPTLSGDLLFVRDVNDLLVALDASTGEQQWQYRRKPDPSRLSELTLYAAPPAHVAGSMVLVGFSDGALVALDRSSGDPFWDLSVGEGRYPDLVAPAATSGMTAFASGYLAPLVALDLKSSTVRWRVDVGASAGVTVVDVPGGQLILHPGIDGVLRAIDPVAGDERWSYDSGLGASLTQPILTEAGALIGGSGGQLAIVDVQTGELVWRWHEDFYLEGLSSAPYVDGRQMVFTTNAGRLYSMLVPQESPPSPAAKRDTGKFRLAYPDERSYGRDR